MLFLFWWGGGGGGGGRHCLRILMLVVCADFV